MKDQKQINSDLQAMFIGGHRNFDLMNVYKGVPFICKATLEKVEAAQAYFNVTPSGSASLSEAKTTMILSDGILEPMEADIVSLDLAAGKLVVNNFVYAGSKFANRRELRVEPGDGVGVIFESGQARAEGVLADASMRGIGAYLDAELFSEPFGQGKTAQITLRFMDGEVKLQGKIRNVARLADQYRLSIEFTGNEPEKVYVVRYIMQRRAEIFDELQALYERLISP